MTVCNLMSFVKGSFDRFDDEERHLNRARQFVDPKLIYDINVSARTLTSILKAEKVTKIDFLSLDVEGYECEVLKGLDLNTYQPKYILVETRPRIVRDLKRLLSQYEEIEIFNREQVNEPAEHWDALYKRK